MRTEWSPTRYPVTIGNGSETLKTFALCDGACIFIVNASLMNVAGVHGTTDINSKTFQVRIGDQAGKVAERDSNSFE